MSIDVGTAIPVPAGTDNYNLVLDLTAMKNGILASIADIVTELGQRPETGSNAAFNTIVTTLGGTFGGSVTINSLNGGSAAVINNSNSIRIVFIDYFLYVYTSVYSIPR